MAVPIGKVIRRLRRDRDWTLADLSNETRKHGRYLVGTTISRHESGQQQPSTDILDIYAKAFGFGTAGNLLRLTSDTPSHTHDPNLHTSKDVGPQAELTYAQVAQITEKLTRVIHDLLEIIRLLGSAPPRTVDEPPRPGVPASPPASRDRARRPGQR